MQKKIGEISEAFEQLKFAEAVALIEQTLKKNSKLDKKQKQLSETQLKLIQCFKTGSLVSLGRYHEASASYKETITPEGVAILGKENPYLFLAISQLFGENKQRQIIELLEKHLPNFDTSRVHRFYINTGLFSSISKFFMKEFANSKNNMCLLDQTYCDYLNQIGKLNLIEYRRDSWFKYHPDVKASLKLVSMFVDKCIKSSEQAKTKIESELSKENILDRQKLKVELQKNIKILQRGNQLKFKIAIHEGRFADAIVIYKSIKPSLKLPFTFIRSIVKLSDILQQKQEISAFYIKQMQDVFKTNLNFATYTPLYDYYDQFFHFLKHEAAGKAVNLQQTIKPIQNTLSFDHLYNFDDLNISAVFQRYYDSLISEFKYLTDSHNPRYGNNKKSDYYKICIKGLLLQIIQINQFLGHQQIKLKYLKQYTSFFNNTLTYSQQLRKYWKGIIQYQILINPTEVDNDNQLIAQINFNKINISVTTTSLGDREQLFKLYDQLMKLYRSRVKEIEKNRKLQKGQRYISDEFVIILTDYIRAFLQGEQQSNSSQQIIQRIVIDLQICVQVSSYNADLKLRLMYFLSLLNHHERLIEVYITNDIKSVQMQTLGYWFLKSALQFGTESKYDFFFERLIRTYHQNQRETSEYGLKALKAGELDRVEQYLVYRTNIMNSYNSLIVFFMLFHKYRFDNNSHYYLLRINERINCFKKKQNSLTFNADFKIMANVLFNDYHFAEIYGIYNHYEVLQQEVNVYLHEQYFINQLLERPNDISLDNIESPDKLESRVNSFETASLYIFSDYAFQEERLDYNLQTSKKSFQRNRKLLDIFKLLMAVRINNLKLSNLLIYSIKTQQAVNQEEAAILEGIILKKIAQLKEFHKSIDYRSQIRSIVLIRRTFFEAHNLLNTIREVTGKTKKLKGVKGAIESVTARVIDEYYNSILNTKWSERSSKAILVSKRDEILERELQMDGKQLKRVISKYQNLIKL